MPDELQDTTSDQNDNRISEPGTSGPFKWFVLVTYIIFSASLAMAQIIFVPIPKQAAAYYGIKGKYSEICEVGSSRHVPLVFQYLFTYRLDLSGTLLSISAVHLIQMLQYSKIL